FVARAKCLESLGRIEKALQDIEHIHEYNGENIDDFYEIEITITENYPNELPYVKEIGGRIPRTLNFHVFPKKETLCMGSPLRLMIQINKNPSLNGFVHICLIPYLYSVSIKIKYGDDFPFGKLDHNREAVLYDYADLLGLETKEEDIETLKLFGVTDEMIERLLASVKERRIREDEKFGRSALNFGGVV
ncbi:hypothetical protein LCGC14_2828570, partial [marine sediment metagenome]